MKKYIVLFLALTMLLALSACGAKDAVEISAVASGAVNVDRETGSVTVEYYNGSDILETEQNGDLLVQVPAGTRLEEINIFAANGTVTVVGVIAEHYDIETVGGDMTIYLPEGTAFHVMLATIRDIFESDFPYDVTMTKNEYIHLTDGLEIEMETIIGIARVMILES